MHVRPAGPADIPALAAFARTTYADAFGHTFDAADLRAHLENRLSDACFLRACREDTFLLATIDGVLVGFLQFGQARIVPVVPESGDREIRRLYVRADVQSRGIGSRLMDAALADPHLRQAEHIYLDVWEGNDGALRFYKRYGFSVIGGHDLMLESGAAEDQDLIMVRHRDRP